MAVRGVRSWSPSLLGRTICVLLWRARSAPDQLVQGGAPTDYDELLDLLKTSPDGITFSATEEIRGLESTTDDAGRP